jgi:hypothetical protein
MCVLGLNALLWGTEVSVMVSHQMHPIYSSRPKMMFGTSLEHFKDAKHVFQGAKKVSHQIHPFDTIRPKMVFGSILEHLKNVWHVIRCKTCVSGLMH